MASSPLVPMGPHQRHETAGTGLREAYVCWQDVARLAGPAYRWAQDWFRPVPVAVADRFVGGLGW